MKNLVISKIIFLFLVIFCGCSSRNPSPNSPAAHGIKVGKIDITVGELADEREDRADKIDLDGQVKERTKTILSKRNLFDPNSPVTLQIHLTSFRLRHGATRYFTGIFSGSDHLKGTISLTQSSTKLLQENIEISGGNGNPFAISSSSRGANLSNDFAQRIVKIIETSPLIQIPEATKADSADSTTLKEPADENKKTAPKVTSRAEAKSCSTEQILKLKDAGLSDEKIKAACGN